MIKVGFFSFLFLFAESIWLEVEISHYHLPDQQKPVLPPSNKSEYCKVHLTSRPANIVNISRLTCRPKNTEKMTFQPTNITMY